MSRYWESKRITLLEGTCRDFLETLHRDIPTNVRVLSGFLPRQTRHPITARFRTVDTVLSDTCQSFLTNDVQYVRTATSSHVEPRHFYRGLSSGWAAIEQNLDVRRQFVDTILTDVVLKDPGDRPESVEIVLIKGHAGAGKSVLLRRIAWDASRDYDAIALMLQPQGAIVVHALRELLAAVDDRLYLFIDDAADRAREITLLLRDIGTDRNRLTIVMAERINEWNIGGNEVDPYLNEQYSVPYLDLTEIGALIDLLTLHRALGTLEQLSASDRISAFDLRAGRQLLVALHEATLGRPFEDIIKDEYENILPAEAQELYLSICVLNRLNVPVRAGLIARMHDIPFEYFRQRFFRPLEHVVQTSYDSLLRDHIYTARHPHIAEIAFQRVLVDPEKRLDKYIRCLAALNIEYTTDEKAFRQMVRGRAIDELFPSGEMARHVFKLARETIGVDAYLLQQMALYEMNSKNGSIHRAVELLDQAANAAPYDFSIKHSRAELSLRLADKARTSLEREKRLRHAEKIANAIRSDRTVRSRGSYAFHTLTKVGLRRLKFRLEDTAPTVSDESVSSAIRSVEASLLEGLQRFPDDPYLRTSEADLATLINDSDRAISAMRSAFTANPRNGVIAVRLAKSLEAAKDHAGARNILQTGLDCSPGDKRLHYALAKYLMLNDPQAAPQIEHHLRRSFTSGDSNFDAQLLYARQLYVNGDQNGSKERFRTLASVKIGPDSRDRLRYPMAGWYRGRVARLEATYCFVARDGAGDWIFAHRSEVTPDLWARLQIDTRVRYHIAFTMKGAAAADMMLDTVAL